MTLAKTWMSLGDILLNKIQQSQKDKHSMIALAGTPGIVRFMETESRRAAARGCGEGRVGRQCVVFSGSRVSVGEDENTLEMGGTDSHTIM